MAIDTGLNLVYNPNYPTPNVSQSSQQFRDNFSIIESAVNSLQLGSTDANSAFSFATIVNGTTGAITYNVNYADNSLILPSGYPISDTDGGAMCFITNAVQIYDGTNWRTLVTANTITNQISAPYLTVTTKLTLNYSPSANTDAVTVAYLTQQLASSSANTTACAVVIANSISYNVQTDLNAEKVNRANADTYLQTQITNLTATANANATALAISAFQVSLNNEANTRATADATLTSSYNSLNSNLNNAVAVSTAIQATIATETTNRVAGDLYLYNLINTAVATSNTIAASVSTETNARVSAISTLTTSLSTETSNRTAAVAAEAVLRAASDSTLTNSIANSLSLFGGTMTNAIVKITNSTSTTITLNGNAGTINASGAITQNSDKTLKNDVRTIEGALDKVCSLRGVYYYRNDLPGNAEHMGLIAQEVNEIIPQVVVRQPDGLLAIAYQNLVAVLVEAIKELRQEVSDLKLNKLER